MKQNSHTLKSSTSVQNPASAGVIMVGIVPKYKQKTKRQNVEKFSRRRRGDGLKIPQ